KGVSQAGAGTATRMLRHFWYEGESHFGIDFGKDQETDRRAQLFYRLALIAFAVDEPYWGYRFLANALHYVQDMTQVFHAKAVLTSKMTDAYALIHAELCRAQIALGHAGDPIPPRCARPEDQLDAAVIKNGWIVGAYHALYEDYVRGMVENYSKAGSAWLSDVDGYFEKQIPAGQLTWRSKSEDTAMGELLDMRQAIRTARKSMLRFSQAVGDSAYEAFGFNIRYHPNIARQALIEAGTPHSLGYRMGRMGYYQEGVDLTYRQQKGEHALAEVTRNVLIHLGVWTREFLSFSLESASSASGRVESERLRQQFRLQCEQGSRKP
ncbi:MAG: hypothetical protein HY074_13060, partial [Deltaproteobacteria bacterium]|nr:hypothetical protein [Deltaproteobacteria bacterium]